MGPSMKRLSQPCVGSHALTELEEQLEETRRRFRIGIQFCNDDVQQSTYEDMRGEEMSSDF